MSWEKSKEVPSVFVCQKPDGYTLMMESVNGMRYVAWVKSGHRTEQMASMAMWSVSNPEGKIVASGCVNPATENYLKEAASMAAEAYKKLTSKED